MPEHAGDILAAFLQGGLTPAQRLLQELLLTSLILYDEWDALPEAQRQEIQDLNERAELIERLSKAQLLTAFQAARLNNGTPASLVLGNYRLLSHLGTGGMGQVFKAEHILLRRIVAIKMLRLDGSGDIHLLARFFSEMRAVAQLHHPNIVSAIDAGKSTSDDGRVLYYLVMEFVPGCDLDEYVRQHQRLEVPVACNLIYQVASALEEAHKHQLVHRDIKPSNILITPELQAKLLDFGLARQFRANRLTQPGTIVGTLDYIAPEQVSDPSRVDIRADLYSLGCTLFWTLTGREPFPRRRQAFADLDARLVQQPPLLRVLRSDVPQGLDEVLQRLLAPRPDDRYPTPQAVMRALLPFLRDETPTAILQPGPLTPKPTNDRARLRRILIVDDEPASRTILKLMLENPEWLCEEAGNGVIALEVLAAGKHDLVLLDIDMPQMSGVEVLQKLREKPPCAHLKIIMFSGRATAEEMAQMMLAGADDYLTKPCSIVQMRARVQAALRLKENQDRADQLTQHLLAANAELDRHLNDRSSDLLHARNALVLTVAKLVEQGSTETGAHLLRMQRYCRRIAEEAASLPAFASQIDPNFITMLESCVPLHDIGKVALPDHILIKAGRLEPDERLIMQTHTTIGSDTLRAVAREHGVAVVFLEMAAEIARWHHERYDGTGYPDRKAGTDIPLAARIVAIADVYDALRSRRPHRPALSHNASVQLMTEASTGQFDPLLLDVFQRSATYFDQIFRELPD